MISIFLATFLLLVSFYFLAIICDEYFVESLDIISHKLHLRPDVAGATFMAIGSSAPELFTSFIAIFSLNTSADIGSGTIVGSALFNILIIIGASSLFRKTKLNWQPILRDLVFYSISIVLLLISFIDGKISLFEAILFVSLYVFYLIIIINWRKINPQEEKSKNQDPIAVVEKEVKANFFAKFSKMVLSLIIPDPNKGKNNYIGTFLTSIGLIGLLSYILVESASSIATDLHISPAIIALTVIAAGTSIPDLLSSVAVAKRGHGNMAISNAVGSNIFDILIGLGLPWLLGIAFYKTKVIVSTQDLLSSVLLLLTSVFITLFVLWKNKWHTSKKIGWLLILLYVSYIVWHIYKIA